MNTGNAETPSQGADNALAVTTKPVGAIGQALPPEQIQTKAPITAAQAKIEAVAQLTMQAYERAATLQITKEESDALLADFPDEAFKPGAAGKENLIYIEHAFLRDRFTQVFGMGQWAIIPRNRWSESFTTFKGTRGERIYVEAMLVVRGCFVGEAVGAMEYYPNNDAQNYGDAVEGAKTAAFRRCAKEFGVGLQAWKKDWCDGWWQRRRAAARGIKPKAEPATPPQAPAPVAPAKPPPPACATEATRTWMIEQLGAFKGAEARAIVTEYFQKIGKILPNEELEQLPLRFIPVSKVELAKLAAAIAEFESGNEAKEAFPPHEDSKPVAKKESKPVAVPRDPVPAATGEEWRTFEMPFGKHEGVPLEELDKKYLYGLWANYEPEETYLGKPKKPETIERDQEFRSMLDQAGEHYQFTKD